MSQKVIKILFLGFLTLILLGVLFFLLERNQILNAAVSKMELKLKKENNVDLKVEKIYFQGLSEIEADKISLVHSGRDSLFISKKLILGINFWPLIFGNIKINTLVLDNTRIHLIDYQGYKNYGFLFKKNKSNSSNTKLSWVINRLIDQFLYKIPEYLNLNDLEISYQKDTSIQKLNIIRAGILKNKLNSTLVFGELTHSQRIHVDGNIQPESKKVDLKLFSEKGTLLFPFLKNKYQMDIQLDTMQMALKGINLNGDLLRIQLLGRFNSLKIQYAKITEDTIRFPNIQFDGSILVTNQSFTIDSGSTFLVNGLKTYPYIQYTYLPSKEYILRFKVPKGEAQKLFDALPEGLFESVKGIKVSGNLAYHINFDLEKDHPNDLEFEAGFDKENFRVISFGNENLKKINGPFTYTPIEHGKSMRPRIMGLSNPNFTFLENISPFLKNSVVASEDPNFFAHHGIDEYAFKKVISIDFKAHSFKRGASTISMQLVKNAFLSRKKTIGRKAEEMLITWLLENANLTSKQRILEVYLNLIEWGPDVYGIGEASHFYFAKNPNELSLGESIFLTHIIPKPKAYQYSFNPDGSLKSYIQGYYRFLSNSLLEKGKITPSDTNTIFQIKIKGPASKYIVKTSDTSKSLLDSLDTNSPLTFPNP